MSEENQPEGRKPNVVVMPGYGVTRVIDLDAQARRREEHLRLTRVPYVPKVNEWDARPAAAAWAAVARGGGEGVDDGEGGVVRGRGRLSGCIGVAKDVVGLISLYALQLPNEVPAHARHGCMDLSKDGRRLVTSNPEAKTVTVWSVGRGREVRTINVRARSLCITDDGRRVVVGGFDNTIRVWDVEEGREVRCMECVGGKPLQRTSDIYDYVGDVAVSGDGRRLFSGGVDGTVRVWDLETGQQQLCVDREQGGHSTYVYHVDISADGSLAVSSDPNSVRVWDVVTGKQLHNFDQGHNHNTSAVMSGDGRYVASGSHHAVKVWEVATGEQVLCCNGHDGPIGAVDITSDGRYMVSGSIDCTVRVWEFGTGTQVATIDGGREQIGWKVRCKGGVGERIACLSAEDGIVRLWDIPTIADGTKVEGATPTVSAAPSALPPAAAP